MGIAAITMVSVSYAPVKKGKKYLLPHPETAAKHIAWGWGKLSEEANVKEMVKAVEDAGKKLKKTK